MPIRLATSNMPATPTVRVDRKPGQRLRGEPRLRLQHVVREDHRPVEVLQEIVDRCPHRRRYGGAITLRHRNQDHLVDNLVEPENRAVQILKRVVELDFGGLGPADGLTDPAPGAAQPTSAKPTAAKPKQGGKGGKRA